MGEQPKATQPVARGQAYVDWNANPDFYKIVIWEPKSHGPDCEIVTEDIVEVRTLSRVARMSWDETHDPNDYRLP